MIYAYAVAEPATALPPPRRRGLGGAVLEVVVVGRLAGVFSRQASAPRPRPTPEAMWEHEHVVEALTERGAVLPMRFGTVLADPATFGEELRGRQDEFLDVLSRVRGRVELGLRVLAEDAPDAGPAQSGRDYILGRLERQREAQRAAHDLHEPLAALACDSRLRRAADASTLLAAAYLVQRDAADAFRRRAADLAAGRPGVRAVVTGPWPPYSFVSEADT